MDTSKIEIRYAELAESGCCLSCGGAEGYANAQEGETCVDLGSGRGTDVLRMAEKVGMSGVAIGVDITEAMIKKAEKQAKKLGVSNSRFIQSELQQIPLSDDTVDLVISNCTINHAEDKQAVWNEVNRILSPGGRFVVSDIYSTTPVPEAYKNDPDAVSECWAGAVTKEEYLKQLNEAGFINVSILEESAPYEKGKIQVSSMTIKGYKKGCCCSM